MRFLHLKNLESQEGGALFVDTHFVCVGYKQTPNKGGGAIFCNKYIVWMCG